MEKDILDKNPSTRGRRRRNRKEGVRRAGCVPDKNSKEQKNFKKGIDFAEQSRYNVELYENDKKGDATHAQH